MWKGSTNRANAILPLRQCIKFITPRTKKLVVQKCTFDQGCTEREISDSNLSEISDSWLWLSKFLTPDSDSLTLREWNWAVKIKSWCTARNVCFNKSFKSNCTISTGIPTLGVWCKTVVSNLWVATPLGVALIFSGVAVTRHMLAVLVQVRCA